MCFRKIPVSLVNGYSTKADFFPILRSPTDYDWRTTTATVRTWFAETRDMLTKIYVQYRSSRTRVWARQNPKRNNDSNIDDGSTEKSDDDRRSQCEDVAPSLVAVCGSGLSLALAGNVNESSGLSAHLSRSRERDNAPLLSRLR